VRLKRVPWKVNKDRRISISRRWEKCPAMPCMFWRSDIGVSCIDDKKQEEVVEIMFRKEHNELAKIPT
jgi:hypothetical protein